MILADLRCGAAAADGRQMRQHLAAQTVQLRCRNAQPRIDHAPHALTDIGRAAGFGKTGGQLFRRDRTALGLLRDVALRLADVAVSVLRGDHQVLPARGDGVKLHRDALRLDGFIGCARRL